MFQTKVLKEESGANRMIIIELSEEKHIFKTDTNTLILIENQ